MKLFEKRRALSHPLVKASLFGSTSLARRRLTSFIFCRDGLSVRIFSRASGGITVGRLIFVPSPTTSARSDKVSARCLRWIGGGARYDRYITCPWAS